MPINPLQQYKEQAANTATPGMLIIMLFDGAIKNIKLAINAIQEHKIEEAHNSIVKAEEIYVYLINSLDVKVPISTDLKKLYDYLLNRLIEANMKKDDTILTEVLEFTVDFRDTWRQAEKNIHIQNQSQTINIRRK